MHPFFQKGVDFKFNTFPWRMQIWKKKLKQEKNKDNGKKNKNNSMEREHNM